MYGITKNTIFKESIQINHMFGKTLKIYTAFFLNYAYFIIFIHIYKLNN